MSDLPAPVVAEQTFDASRSILWKAITEADEMRRWFFEPIQEFRPELGFETEFVVHCDGTDYPHLWRVTEVDPESKIVYDWRYGGFAGSSQVTWELNETAAGTRLTVTHQSIEPFPQDNPIFSRESGQAGWDYFLGESLPDYLQRRPS